MRARSVCCLVLAVGLTGAAVIPRSSLLDRMGWLAGCAGPDRDRDRRLR